MGKLKKKIKWKSLTSDISDFGFGFSIKNFLVSVLIMVLFIVFTTLLYKVDILYQIILLVIGILLVPSIVKSRYISKYEEKRFMDICSYMEQVCSSFWKQSKIIAALNDSRLIIDGKLGRLLDSSIGYLEKGISSKEDVYTESLSIIENHYSCKRLTSLHKFLVKIEISGGGYYSSLNVILQDIRSWSERTIIFENNKKTIQINYIFVLLMSIFSCTLATLLSYISAGQDDFLSTYLDITANPTYQLMTSLFIASCLISFTMIQRKLSASWLEKATNEKLLMSDYNIALNYNYKKRLVRRTPILIFIIIIYILMTISAFRIYSYIPLILGVLYFLFPIFKYRGARKRTIQEIKMAFPEWLRDVMINSQYQTIQMAIQSSLESSPKILVNSIENLIYQLNENPKGIQPYNNFLSEFELSEVKSAMRILYSMSELSYGKSQEMLDVLIKQNYILIDKAESAYYNNKMIILKQLLYLPMIFSICKIIVDLFLFASSFFDGFSNFNNMIL